jgi:hypothetical protein
MDIRDDAFEAILEGLFSVSLAAAGLGFELGQSLINTFYRGVVADVRAHSAHRESEIMRDIRSLVPFCVYFFRKHTFSSLMAARVEARQTPRIRRFCDAYSEVCLDDHARKLGQLGNALKLRADEILR